MQPRPTQSTPSTHSKSSSFLKMMPSMSLHTVHMTKHSLHSSGGIL